MQRTSLSIASSRSLAVHWSSAIGTALAVLLFLTFASAPAWSGPNAGGVLIVHETTGLATVCDYEIPAPECAAADRMAETSVPVCWRVYAAFPAGTSPRLKTLSWGCSLTPSIHVTDAGLPDPDLDFEITQAGWPSADGCSIGESFWATQTSQVVYCHWFEGYATGPGSWSAAPHIVQESVMLDDATPPNIDDIQGYGSLGFGQDGETPCPEPAQGACCFGDGSCQFLFPADCATSGGFYYDLIPCNPNPCPVGLGACCLEDGTCAVVREDACAGLDGAWLGTDVSCVPNPCDQPFGACCFGDGHCEYQLPAPCGGVGGSWQGPGTDCSPNPCPMSWGACCFPSGLCQYRDALGCADEGGDWQGPGVFCTPNPCPIPMVGACCFADGHCEFLSEAACSIQGGSWQGLYTDCAPNPCPIPTGACCNHGTGDCAITTPDACAYDWLGADVACEPTTCEILPGACCDTATGDCAVTYLSECQYDWMGADVPCEPQTCVGSTPAERTSWGRVKVIFR